MNNPFLRLKHYLRGEIDPAENHATECLAACLVFSPRIRDTFINFLFRDAGNTNCSDTEIETQAYLDTGRCIDLVLRKTGKFVVAVEVKVGSPEDRRHSEQLTCYRKWLNAQGEPVKRLFTLVQNAKPDFRPGDHGADDRRTWAELHKVLQELSKNNELSDSESSLVTNFCGYLEEEEIVSTYDINNLLDFDKGLKARAAVNSLFKQLSAQLEQKQFRCESDVDKKDSWPQLRIQRPQWERIFGKGDNWKVLLWFCVPGIWGQSVGKYAFSPDLQLWHKDHGNSWRSVRPKLASWVTKLNSQGFSSSVYQKSWYKSRDIVSMNEIEAEPKQLSASREVDNIELDQDHMLSEDELLRLLMDRVIEYANIVDLLGD
jgi:hypothetical protein